MEESCARVEHIVSLEDRQPAHFSDMWHRAKQELVFRGEAGPCLHFLRQNQMIVQKVFAKCLIM